VVNWESRYSPIVIKESHHSKMLPIYLINQESQIARKARILFRLQKVFPDGKVNLIRAVDDEKELAPLMAQGLTKGVAGCLASHYQILQKIGEGKEPHALVVEDDAMFSHLFDQAQLESLLTRYPLILLSPYYSRNFPPSPCQSEKICQSLLYPIPSSGVWSTAAFFITRTYAQKMLETIKLDRLAEWRDKVGFVTSELITTLSEGIFTWPPLVIEECIETAIQELPISMKMSYWRNFGLNNFLLEGDPVIPLWRDLQYLPPSASLPASLRAVYIAPRNPFEERDRFAEEIKQGKEPSVYSLTAWEIDYLQFLFNPWVKKSDWRWIKQPQELNGEEIVAFSTNQHPINEITTRSSPLVLVMLSDEWGKTPSVHYQTAHLPLVLRQHCCPSYHYPPNVQVMALGVMEGMFSLEELEGQIRITQENKIVDRKRQYDCSFMGTVRDDRKKAIDSLLASPLSSYIGSGKIKEMRHIYQSSTFVICPRGNVSLDCFRIYEAILCGAIPVIAGCSEEEFNRSFTHLGFAKASASSADLKSCLGWVFAPEWRDALKECYRLLKVPKELNERRLQTSQSWAFHILYLRKKINEALKSHNSKDLSQQVKNIDLFANWTTDPLEEWKKLLPSDYPYSVSSQAGLRHSQRVILNGTGLFPPCLTPRDGSREDFLFTMEPASARSYLPKEWTAVKPRLPRQLIEWHISATYDELANFQGHRLKTKTLSAIVSSENFLPGHQLRLSFLKFLEESGKVSFDHYGRDNKYELKSYRGSLPRHHKEDGLIPYRYTMNFENTFQKGYFTEKLIDAVLAECLCFYWGCPDINQYLDPQAIVLLDPTDFARSEAIILRTIEENEYEKRLPIIQRERRRILHLSVFPTIHRCLNEVDLPSIPAYVKVEEMKQWISFEKRALKAGFEKFAPLESKSDNGLIENAMLLDEEECLLLSADVLFPPSFGSEWRKEYSKLSPNIDIYFFGEVLSPSGKLLYSSPEEFLTHPAILLRNHALQKIRDGKDLKISKLKTSLTWQRADKASGEASY
jgi:hypothetical protein